MNASVRTLAGIGSATHSAGMREHGHVMIYLPEVARGRALAEQVRAIGYDVELESRFETAAAGLADMRLAVALLDSGPDGLAFLDYLRAMREDVAALAVTSAPSLDDALRAIRAGALDYLELPETSGGATRPDRLALCDALDRAFALRESSAGRAGPAERRAPSAGHEAFPGWIAEETIPLSLAAYEKLALERALRESAGDARDAARRLGIGRSTFYRRAARVGLQLTGLQSRGRRESTPNGVGRPPPIG